MIKGLSKEEKSDLLIQYRLPNNCLALTAPNINPEIAVILSNAHQKRDACNFEFQVQLGAAISAIGKGMNQIIENDLCPAGFKQNLLKCFGDSARILGDLDHDLIELRRNYVYPSVNKSIKEVLEKNFTCWLTFWKQVGGEN